MANLKTVKNGIVHKWTEAQWKTLGSDKYGHEVIESEAEQAIEPQAEVKTRAKRTKK